MNAETLLSSLTGNPIVLGALLLSLTAVIINIYLSLRLDRLLKGGDGKSLESTIRALHEKVRLLEEHAARTTEALTDANRRLVRSIQGVSVKRFDPFQNAGGQQSFATAFLNEEGSGVVVSGIHARDGVRVYAKEVKSFKSERELSEEEQGSIDETKSKLGK
jgi:hypothetical protein